MKIYSIIILNEIEGAGANASTTPFFDIEEAKAYFEVVLDSLKGTYGLKPNFEPTDAHFEDGFKASFSRNENSANVTWQIIEQVATNNKLKVSIL